MIVSIMQPYFFPYIGYFQLMRQSDVFVFHDDVQYIKGGWVNRNRILRDGVPVWLTLPVRKAAADLAINQRRYRLDRGTIASMLRRIKAAYRRAPQFAAVFPVVEELLNFADENIAAFNINLLERIAARLGIGTRFLVSSAMEKDNRLKGQMRVFDMCRRLRATTYVNPIGGTMLYQPDAFAAAGIELRFLQPTPLSYPQFGAAPVADLSIIDALMFNDEEAAAGLLDKYRLPAPPQAR